MKWLLFLYPWLELWSLIELGAQTSATSTMLWVLCAGVLGIGLFRLAGRQTLEHLQQAQREGVLRQQLLIGNVARLIAGVLLIIPGLISDALALVVLLAPLRILLAKLLVGGSVGARYSEYQAQGESSGFHTGSGDTRFEDVGVTVEGEFESASNTDGAESETAAPLGYQPSERD